MPKTGLGVGAFRHFYAGNVSHHLGVKFGGVYAAVFGVGFQVKLAQKVLAQEGRSLPGVAGLYHGVYQLVRYLLAGFVMGRYFFKHLRLPGPVFQQLGVGFYIVPSHIIPR